MSSAFTTDDITNMREAQGIHAYTDRMTYIAAPDPNTTDEYGQVTPTTSEVSGECAFVDNAKRETWRQADIEELDAEVYFDYITPTKGGKVKIISRFGQDVTNRTFDIVGIQDRGAYGWVCALKVTSI